MADPDGRKTILCAEDEEVQLHLRKVLFELAGYRVLLACSGDEALRLFRTETVDAAVLDYSLAGLDGVAVADCIKQTRPEVPVIILSGSSARSDQIAGPIDRWFQKSEVEPEDLLATLHDLLNLRANDVSA